LPGFPSNRPVDIGVDERPAQVTSSEEDSDGVTELTITDGQKHDEKTSDEEQGNQDMPKKEWIGLKIARLNDGSHIIMGLVMGSSAATSGELQIGEKLSQIDDIEIVHLPTSQ